MKVTPEEPTVAAAVAYFVDMAKGETASTRQNGRNGLGAVHHPTTYHVIPTVKLVTPSAQALIQAKAKLPREKVIRGESRKRTSDSSSEQSKKKQQKKKTTGEYSMPGLD